MHGRFLWQAVFHKHAQSLALFDADLGSGHRPVVSPHFCLLPGSADDRRVGYRCKEFVLANH
jgi:hypothetical protein